METFSVLLAICAGNSPVPGEFPTQRPVTRSFHVFFDLRLNKLLSKQSWGWWFEKSTECMANASIPVNQFLSRKPLKLWNSPEENNLGHDLQSMLIPQNYYVHQQIMNAWLSFFRLYM